jgi:hypothetical protein
VLQLGQQPQGEAGSSEVLCLVALQVAMEELAIREHQLMPHARKLQLRQQLHVHAPHMLTYVTGAFVLSYFDQICSNIIGRDLIRKIFKKFHASIY